MAKTCGFCRRYNKRGLGFVLRRIYLALEVVGVEVAADAVEGADVEVEMEASKLLMVHERAKGKANNQN
jgi:hypothetical protein